MLINLSDFFLYDGMKKEIHKSILFDSIQFDGDLYEVVDPIKLKITILHRGNREINLNGSIETTLVIPCHRCAEPVNYPLKADFSKEVAFHSSEFKDISYMDGYNLDLEKLVFNELIIAFPMKVLCHESCKGICKHCGKNLNDGPCECQNDDIDPRLAVLKDLFKEE